MKRYAAIFCLFICLFCMTGCMAEQNRLPAERTHEAVRTFAPDDAPTATAIPEKRGILQSLSSPSGLKTAYIYTLNAAADTVEYELKILDAEEPFTYEQGTVLYRSSFLFDIEWGDETSLMVSLNEKETADPAPVTEQGVMVMFGRISTAQS